MSARAMSLLILGGSFLPSANAATYQLNEPALFDQHPFGYSGFIETDGTTGTLADTDFIRSWRITVETPGDVDGVVSEVLTPDNSSVELRLETTTGLIVTPDFLSMPVKVSPVRLNPLATLTWSTLDGETTLQFTNRFTITPGSGSGVSVFDPSEPNSTLGIVSDFAVASVPEPGSGELAVFLACALSPRRRRVSTVSLQLNSPANSKAGRIVFAPPC